MRLARLSQNKFPQAIIGAFPLGGTWHNARPQSAHLSIMHIVHMPHCIRAYLITTLAFVIRQTRKKIRPKLCCITKCGVFFLMKSNAPSTLEWFASVESVATYLSVSLRVFINVCNMLTLIEKQVCNMANAAVLVEAA